MNLSNLSMSQQNVANIFQQFQIRQPVNNNFAPNINSYDAKNVNAGGINKVNNQLGYVCNNPFLNTNAEQFVNMPINNLHNTLHNNLMPSNIFGSSSNSNNVMPDNSMQLQNMISTCFTNAIKSMFNQPLVLPNNIFSNAANAIDCLPQNTQQVNESNQFILPQVDPNLAQKIIFQLVNQLIEKGEINSNNFKESLIKMLEKPIESISESNISPSKADYSDFNTSNEHIYINKGKFVQTNKLVKTPTLKNSLIKDNENRNESKNDECIISSIQTEENTILPLYPNLNTHSIHLNSENRNSERNLKNKKKYSSRYKRKSEIENLELEYCTLEKYNSDSTIVEDKDAPDILDSSVEKSELVKITKKSKNIVKNSPKYDDIIKNSPKYDDSENLRVKNCKVILSRIEYKSDDTLTKQIAEDIPVVNIDVKCQKEPSTKKIKNFLQTTITNKSKDTKKEKSTDCDSALIPLLCVHG